MNIDIFINELKKINIDISNEQLNQLEKYYDLLIEYNKVMNLTGITEKKDVYLKHFYDSLTIFKVVDLSKINNLCDIGTGAGFPGLVIKILFPNINVTLIDSLNKRIKFLNIVIEELGLKNIETIHIRAEEYARNNRNKYDITTSRAVAHLSTLLEYAIPMTKVNGYFVALKGNIDEELIESNNAIKKLDITLKMKEEFYLPFEDSKRTIIGFKKNKDIKKYPRINNEIKKNRL